MGAHVTSSLNLSVQELKYIVESLGTRINSDKSKTMTPSQEAAHKSRIKAHRKVSQHLADKLCGDYADPKFTSVPTVHQDSCGSDQVIEPISFTIPSFANGEL